MVVKLSADLNVLSQRSIISAVLANTSSPNVVGRITNFASFFLPKRMSCLQKPYQARTVLGEMLVMIENSPHSAHTSFRLRLFAGLITSCLLSSMAMATPTPRPSPSAPQANKKRTEYHAFISAKSSYEVNKTGHVAVSVHALKGYHINKDYPTKFKLDEAPTGLSYPKKVLKRKDAAQTESSASFAVPFVAREPGEKKLSGTFYFSVCSDSTCLMQKVKLSTKIKVKLV
jgi:hypothetical protein